MEKVAQITGSLFAVNEVSKRVEIHVREMLHDDSDQRGGPPCVLLTL